jgi:hypothetical protein
MVSVHLRADMLRQAVRDVREGYHDGWTEALAQIEAELHQLAIDMAGPEHPHGVRRRTRPSPAAHADLLEQQESTAAIAAE